MVGIIAAIFLLVIPVHKDLLSILLVFSIAISILILLTVIYLEDPSEFSVFPTLLLAVTLYRLGLNVASTRLILLDGDAGSVIKSFGTFTCFALRYSPSDLANASTFVFEEAPSSRISLI